MIIKNLISKGERELVLGIKRGLYEELKGLSEYDENLNINKRFIDCLTTSLEKYNENLFSKK